MEKNVGDDFQAETKYARNKRLGGNLDWSNKPEIYKSYPSSKTSTGIQRTEHGYEFRTAPSAGALYPIETYIAANNVEDIEQGLYHYNIKSHLIEEIKLGNFGEKLARAALDQEMCADASVVFIWTAVFRRAKWKYSQRAYRYIYLDAGHIAQNLGLAVTNVGCGSCEVGAFFDDEINSLLGIDGTEESTVCLSVVGHLK